MPSKIIQNAYHGGEKRRKNLPLSKRRMITKEQRQTTTKDDSVN